jgi:ATP-dependent DNA helicase RecG
VVSQQLHLFDSLSEGRDIEFKSARGGLPRSLWETYSAFANTAGGVIYLGIRETDEGAVVQGVDDPDGLLRDFWAAINNRQKVNENLLEADDVEVLELDNRYVLEIHVPRASREQRPVYVGLDPYEGSYRRDHEGDFKCRRSEVQRMFADQSDAVAADSRILEHFGLEDFDEASLRQYRNRMASRQPSHPWLSLEDTEFLAKLGGWRRDRATGLEGPTVAGLLMFGRTQAITDNEAVPAFQVDYRERLAADENVRWSDRLTVDGTWEANLFQFYMRVVQKIHNDDALKIPFARNAQGYREGQTVVHEALQEALVNALIHADHAGQGGIIVERFAEHFEFSNPGTLLLSVEQLICGGVSECRNKSLQTMFQMLGAGDRAGSGLDKIRSSWHAQHWQSPSLHERFRPDRVKLILPMVSLLPDGFLQAIRHRFGETSVRALDEDEVQTLVTAAFEGQVTNQRLQSMLTAHRVDITQILRGLVDKGFLEAHGQRRGAYYTLVGGKIPDNQNAAILGSRRIGSADVPLNEPGSPHNAPDSAHSESFPPHNEPFSPHNAGRESHSEHATSGRATGPASREDVQTLLERIAEPVSRRARVRPELLRQTILALCNHGYLSLRDIAGLLRRDARNLRDRHISVLVERGALRLEYPEVPNHRKQRYVTAVGENK